MQQVLRISVCKILVFFYNMQDVSSHNFPVFFYLRTFFPGISKTNERELRFSKTKCNNKANHECFFFLLSRILDTCAQLACCKLPRRIDQLR